VPQYNRHRVPPRPLTALLLLLASSLAAADFFPLDRVKPGLKAVGRTVFSGDKIEEFQAEILGVLHNVGPRQSIILARLSGGPLARTGVMSGMSGSPIYIDGKLAGAVAFAFPFASEPIAGIRPIAEMVDIFEQRRDPPPPARRAAIAAIPAASGAALERWIPAPDAPWLPPAQESFAAEPRLLPIATPVNLAGFTERALERFGPALRDLGLVPAQGAGSAASAQSSELGDYSKLEPGSTISVGLVRGDLNVTAEGVLTHIDGRRIYAFGHRFLSSGPTELPVMKASVIALIPSRNTSLKVSSAGELIGTIRQDRSTGVLGELGARPRLLPVEIELHSSRSGNHSYRLEMVNDRFLSPFLLQMALFSAIDATERSLGASTIRLRGSIRLAGGRAPVELDNIYAAESSAASLASLGATLPLAQMMQSGFPDLRAERIRLEVVSLDEKRQLRLERAWASKREARPGEPLELAAALRGENGQEVVRKTPFEIPAGAPAGPLNVTFADGASMNLLDLSAAGAAREAASGSQLVRAINQSRKNNSLYVRVWRSDRGFALHNEPLPSPPASLRAILESGSTGAAATWSSILAEMEIGGLDRVVSGSTTIRLTVRE